MVFHEYLLVVHLLLLGSGTLPLMMNSGTLVGAEMLCNLIFCHFMQAERASEVTEVNKKYEHCSICCGHSKSPGEWAHTGHKQIWYM